MEEELQYLDVGSTLEPPQPMASNPDEATSNLEKISGYPPVSMVSNTDWCECSCCSPIGRFSNTVNVDVNAINCHGHGRANFRLRVDRVFTTRPARLTCRDADVPVHVFLTLIFEFFTLLCDYMLAVCML